MAHTHKHARKHAHRHTRKAGGVNIGTSGISRNALRKLKNKQKSNKAFKQMSIAQNAFVNRTNANAFRTSAPVPVKVIARNPTVLPPVLTHVLTPGVANKMLMNNSHNMTPVLQEVTSAQMTSSRYNMLNSAIMKLNNAADNLHKTLNAVKHLK